MFDGLLLRYCIGKIFGPGLVMKYGPLLGYFVGIRIQSEYVFVRSI